MSSLPNESNLSLSLSYLKMLTGYEELLADLYQAFESAVPRHADIWRRIAREEKGHATYLRRLEGNLRDGEVCFTGKRVHIVEIRDGMEGIHRQLRRVKNVGIRPSEALKVALRFERDVVEQQYMTNLVTGCPELREVFDLLAEESAAHYDAIAKLAARPPLSPPWVRKLLKRWQQRRKGEEQTD